MVTSPKSAKEIEDGLSPVVETRTEIKETPFKATAPAKMGKLLSKLPDRVPSHWHIRDSEDEEGIIIATCSTCRDIFRGTVAEFNAALRN